MNTVVTDLIDTERPATAGLPAQQPGSTLDAPVAAPAPLPPPTMATLAAPTTPAVAPAQPLAPTPTPDLTPAPTAVEATTPTAPTPGLATGPAAILSPDPTYAPLDQSVPSLPTATAVAPANTAAASLDHAPDAPLTLDDILAQQPKTGKNNKKKQQQGSSVGRTFRRLLLLAVLAGGGYAAYAYGPDLYDRYTNGEATEGGEAAGSEPVETDAPLAFPSPAPATGPIRTAEFILEGLPGAPDMTYRVTTDFETNVSQVDLSRPKGPDLQVLTYGDAALIRRTDASQWYHLERGRFPLDDRLERSDWVRQLDELLPTAVRSSVSIDAAGETKVSGVPTRHLSLTLDISLLGGTTSTSVPDADTPPTDPALTEPVASSAVVPTEAANPDPDGLAAQDAATSSLETSLEVWIDAEGIVRKVSGAPVLGADTITVVSTDSGAWVPDYPTPELVQPLTAATLVELGI